MTYRVKFIISVVVSIIAAVALLMVGNSLSGGNLSVLPVFIVLFVIFGLVASSTFYFRERSGKEPMSEQELIDQARREIQVKQRNGK